MTNAPHRMDNVRSSIDASSMNEEQLSFPLSGGPPPTDARDDRGVVGLSTTVAAVANDALNCPCWRERGSRHPGGSKGAEAEDATQRATRSSATLASSL